MLRLRSLEPESSYLSPRLKDVLQITKLLTVFEVFDRAEEAAAVFNPTAGQSKPKEWH